MKQSVLLITLLMSGPFLFSQPDKTKYPEPEFSKEVYSLKKDSLVSLIRLEKGVSKMETKTKMGGMAGSESGYQLENEKSPVRIAGGGNLSFVFSTGATARQSSPKTDSMMRANGMDPAMMESMGAMMDPMNTISLYRVDPGKNNRKIVLQKSPGAMPFGSKKMRSSDKFTFSVKKIREGYWELVIDKSLPKGEYAFTQMDMGSMDGSMLLFAFGVD